MLEVSNARIAGKIFYRDGTDRPRAGRGGHGETAFNLLLALGGGQFNSPFSEPRSRTVTGQWEFLVMEAARKSDEAKGALAAAPVVPTPTESSPLEPPPTSAAVAAEVERIMAANRASEVAPGARCYTGKLHQRVRGWRQAVGCGVSTCAGAEISAWRGDPRDEMPILSGQGEVLYQWQCPNAELWVNF